MNRDERIATIAHEIEGTERAVAKDPSLRRTVRLWCKGQWSDFPVYRVPTDALVLNTDNRRFVAERTLYEQLLGHSLDPENNPNDEISLISMLLDGSPQVDGDVVKGAPAKASEALRLDWNKRKQESPFWIRPDGMVRNGNRRLAMLKRMRANEGVTGTESVEAIVLNESDIDELELFEMEQREQLTENFKVRYTDINLLITLKEAAEGRSIDWNDPQDIERVAGLLQDRVEGGKPYAVIQLRAIKYMDDYLNDIGASGEYYKLIGQIERFRDVGKNMTKLLDNYPDDSADMLRLQFAGITAGITHGSIRSIGKVFLKDRDEYRRIRDDVFKLEDANEGHTELEAPQLNDAEEDDTDSDSDLDEPSPSVVGYPKDRVQSAIKNGIDAYEVKTLDLPSTLAQVASRLRVLEPSKVRDALSTSEAEEIKPAIAEILSWTDSIKALLPNG